MLLLHKGIDNRRHSTHNNIFPQMLQHCFVNHCRYFLFLFKILFQDRNLIVPIVDRPQILFKIERMHLYLLLISDRNRRHFPIADAK